MFGDGVSAELKTQQRDAWAETLAAKFGSVTEAKAGRPDSVRGSEAFELLATACRGCSN